MIIIQGVVREVVNPCDYFLWGYIKNIDTPITPKQRKNNRSQP